MNLLTKILIGIALIITAFPFALYGLYIIRQGLELKKWREGLVKGMNVIVDDGRNIFKGRILGVRPGWVRIETLDGRSAGFSIKVIYPVNFFRDYESYDTKDNGSAI
jgi:hypothetical protein